MSDEFNKKYVEAYHIIGCLLTLMTLPTQMSKLMVPCLGRWYTYEAIPQLIIQLFSDGTAEGVKLAQHLTDARKSSTRKESLRITLDKAV